jgi:hypothetical protein
MKQLPIFYKGYKFRNKAVAKWAVFFDYLGIKYEYQKESFQLDSGEIYTPDFWLPEWHGGVWANVTKEGKPNNKELYKMSQLVEVTQGTGYILNGVPDFKYYKRVYFVRATEDCYFLAEDGSKTSGTNEDSVGFCFDQYQYLDGVWIDPYESEIEDMFSGSFEDSFWYKYKEAVYASRAFTFELEVDMQAERKREIEALLNRKQALRDSKKEQFSGLEIKSIFIGLIVEHLKFGIGKIISIKDFSNNDKSVKIDFEDYGEKTFLTSCTKLRVVEY